MRSRRAVLGILLLCGSSAIFQSCGGGGASTPPTVVTRAPVTVSLSALALTIVPNRNPATALNVSVGRPSGDTDNVSLTVTPLPAGIQTQITQPGSGTSGTIAFTVSSQATAGTYALTVQASDSQSTASSTLSLVVPVFISGIGAAQSPVAPLGLTTNYQAASWSEPAQSINPGEKLAELNALVQPATGAPIRVQAVERAIAEYAPGAWDFSTLNAFITPLLNGTNPIELQLARAPDYLYDSAGNLPSSAFPAFAQYVANVYAYYNTTSGFTDRNGIQHSYAVDSGTGSPADIQYWGIYNEPNYNGVSASAYPALYSQAVAAINAVPSSVTPIFLALEMGDSYSTDAQAYFQDFFLTNHGNNAIVATHYYSSCNQADSDQKLFDQIPNAFVPELQFIHNQMVQAGDNGNIWITENNVNADYSNNGKSACNGGPFTVDTRGTSAFFAAWRPYEFVAFQNLGYVDTLFHWAFDSDKQYGEVDDNGNKYLSYWVDYELNQFQLEACPNASACSIHRVASNLPANGSTVEVLALGAGLMIVNHGVAHPGDNNGPGVAQTVVLQTGSTMGPYNQVVLDANTDLINGPSTTVIPAGNQITLTMNGYSTILLTPASGNGHARKANTGTPTGLPGVSGVLTTGDCLSADDCSSDSR